MSSEKVPVQVSAREGYKVKKSRTGKAVMGLWALVGVTCLCAGMVLADVPERIGGRYGHE